MVSVLVLLVVVVPVVAFADAGFEETLDVERPEGVGEAADVKVVS